MWRHHVRLAARLLELYGDGSSNRPVCTPFGGRGVLTEARADLVVKGLGMAYEERGRPQNVLFHSGSGSQYGSRDFREGLWRYLFRQSMSRRGTYYDNAPMDRFS